MPDKVQVASVQFELRDIPGGGRRRLARVVFNVDQSKVGLPDLQIPVWVDCTNKPEDDVLVRAKDRFHRFTRDLQMDTATWASGPSG